MKFPVDLLANVSHTELEQSAHNYMNNLLYNSPDSPPHLTFSDSTKVAIDISSVGVIPLYGSSDKHKILALFSPSDPFTAVALYLLDQWWTVDDILKTADTARDGAVEVESVGERIVLFILNRVVYRAKEMNSEEFPFLCHGEKDYAKILWRNGEAVGFYSVKPAGTSLCNSLSARRYLLPVMDSMFVRKSQRGKGFGLQMMEDFVLSFKEGSLGLRYPLTKAMYKVCEKYLCQYPGDTDLLWEVESIGTPNQRTSIATKIQGMDLSCVSKGLSFTEESCVITEVTEKNEQREELAKQIKEDKSTEYAVVEEATVLRVTKVSQAEEVPVAVRGRSSDSKRRNSTEKTPEDKSEKVIRIEDIEAVTSRQQHVSVQGKTVQHVFDLEQTEFRVAAEENDKELVDSVPEDEAAMMLDKLATALPSHDLEEPDVVATPLTKGPQVEDDATQYLKNESKIIENVTSEIEETEEECQKEDTEESVSSEEPLEVRKEAETLDEVGEGTEINVSDEKSERITCHELSLLTHAPSEDTEDEKTGKNVLKVHRQRSEQQSQPQEAVMEETTAKDGGKSVRQRIVLSTSTHNQEVCEELEKEVDEDADKSEGFTIEVEKFTGMERKEQEEITSIKEDLVTVGNLLDRERQQNEDEQETKKEDGEVRASTKLPDTAETDLTKEKVTDESDKEQRGEAVETSLIQDKQEDSDEEIEEPPVVLMRTVRGRKTVSHEPKPRQKKTKTHQNQEPTDQADLRAGGSAEEKADEQAVERQMEEHHKVEDEKPVDKTEEEILTTRICESVLIEVTFPKAKGAAGDAVSSSEMNMENREVDKEDTGMVSGMINKHAVPASNTVMTEVQGEAGGSGDKEAQDKDIASASEVQKLQNATVVLVDLRSTCHHLSVNKAEEKTFDRESADPELQQMELVAAEEKQVSSCIAEEQTSGPEIIMLGEEDGRKRENFTEKSVHATTEVDTVKKDELGESNSGNEDKSSSVDEKKTEAAVIKTRGKSNQQQRGDNSGEDIIEKEVEKADGGTTEVEGAMEAVALEAEMVIVPAEEKESVSECADTKANITVSDDAEKGPVVETRSLRSGPKTVLATPTHKTARSRKQGDEQGAQSHDEEIALTTRTQKRGKISVSAVPKDAGVEKAAVKEAALEKYNEEGEEKTEEVGTMIMQGAASETEETIEPEMDAQKRKTVSEEGLNVGEIQSESTSKIFADREAEASSENYDMKPVTAVEEVAAVTKSLRSGGKTSRAPPKTRSRRSKKREDEDEEEGGESVEKSTDGDELPIETEGDKRKAPDDDRRGVKSEELVSAEVEEISEKGTMSKTEEEENTAGVTAVTKDAPEAGRAGTTETDEDDNTEAPVVADERKPSEDTEEGEQSIYTSEVAETAAGHSAQKTLLVAKDNKPKGVSNEEEAAVFETRVLRSSEKAVTAKYQDKATKRQDDEQEMVAAGEKIAKDESAVETRVLRKGRRPFLATPRHISKRARTQYQPKEELKGAITPAEETKGEETKANQDKNSHEEIGEMDDEEVVAQKEDANPEDEMKKVESVPLTDTGSYTTTVEEPIVEDAYAVAQEAPAVTRPPQNKKNPSNKKIKVKKAEEKSPQSAQKRSLRKRKTAEVTPECKSKRHSRI